LNNSVKNDRRNSAINKVSLSPKFSNKRIITEFFKLVLERSNLLMGLWAKLLFRSDFFMKIFLGWDQVLIELGNELFVFDGVRVYVVL
jgi:hypothetical protein